MHCLPRLAFVIIGLRLSEKIKIKKIVKGNQIVNNYIIKMNTNKKNNKK